MHRDRYPAIGRQAFLDRLQPLNKPVHMEVIEAAYILSKYAHRGQLRQNGVRYFEHPKAVAWILIDELGLSSWRIIVLALLHDVPEDSFLLSWYRIELNFGTKVMMGLKLLTNKPDKEGYVGRLHGSASWQVLMVKLADRLHNLRTLDDCALEKQRRKVEETRDQYLRLFDRLFEIVPKRHRRAARKLHAEFIQELVRLEVRLQGE